ncbi:MAG: patatin-like phospholipase family protein [Acidimicrobiales bacterium]
MTDGAAAKGTTAWLLRGGASLGAAQVGMARALIEAGCHPDMLFGASAGALNAAWIANDPTLHGLNSLSRRWQEVRRRDIFPFSPWDLTAALVKQSDHTVGSTSFAKWLRANIPLTRLENSALPLVVVATDLESGEAVLIERGPAVPALLASCAMPAVFKPVRLNGQWLVDGSVASDTPVEAAIKAGAQRVYVLQGVPTAPTAKPRTALDVLLRSVSITLARYSESTMAAWAGACELYLVPAPLVPGTSPFSFRNSKKLIDAGYAHTLEWLHQARPLEPGRKPVLEPPRVAGTNF